MMLLLLGLCRQIIHIQLLARRRIMLKSALIELIKLRLIGCLGGCGAARRRGHHHRRRFQVVDHHLVVV